jgi:hypothetical protein
MRQPWGEYAADLRAGVIASTIANVNRSKDAPAFSPLDFMPLQKDRTEAEQVDADPSEFFKKLEQNG